MSDAIFPTFSGLTFDVRANTQFKTVVHEHDDGGESRARFRAYPIWLFSLNFDCLDDTPEGNADLQRLHGFICQRQGRFDSFLYAHPSAHAVNSGGIATADGVRTEFQLIRRFSVFLEPVHNPNTDDMVLTLDGIAVPVADYTVQANGLVVFDVPPPAGAVLRWSGSYWFRCRFDNDETDFYEFADRLYRYEGLQFRGSLQNIL